MYFRRFSDFKSKYPMLHIFLLNALYIIFHEQSLDGKTLADTDKL